MNVKTHAEHAVKYWPLYAVVAGAIVSGITFKVQAEQRFQTIEAVVVEQANQRDDVTILKTQVENIQDDLKEQNEALREQTKVLQQILIQTQ